MTRKRNDKHSTEFGLWLREKEEIDSKLGYITSNLDFIWTNYKSKLYLLIEEKRYNKQISFPQAELFKIIHKNCLNDPNYRGFHFILFEKTSPDDGWIKIDNEIVNCDNLISFLKFKSSRSKYDKFII